jgi:ABC-type polysaccharide/polyol phosphate export permease
MNSIRMFFKFIKELADKKNVIYELTKRDFKSSYLGSYLGIVWAFILPIALTLIFWFVFQVGYNARPVDNYPFILWLVCGMFPWFFFNDCLNNGTGAIVQNSFIVKKVAFSIGILPIIKILSALIIHFFFVLLIVAMFLYYGHAPDIYVVQVVYYLAAMIIFSCGLTWLTSSVVIFFRDMQPIIAILLQMGFYLTPIFWNLKILPEKYRIIIKFNPIYYIVEGYRDSFIYKVWFWQHPGMTLYFWAVTAVVFVGGAVVFRRLRPHFADVL